MDEPSDAQLMAQIRHGDRDAFALLVERHKNPLVNYLTRMAGSRDRAEDLAQDAFVRLYQTAGSYQEQGKLLPFLFRIATNLLRSEERRTRRWRVISKLLPINGHVHNFSPQFDLLREEKHQRVADALANLPMNFRVPLVLRDLQDWSYEEIAQATGLPEGTVKSRVSRARQQLREKLAAYIEGGAA